MNSRTLLGIWFRQQAELAMPDPAIDPAVIAQLVQPPATPAGTEPVPAAAPHGRGTAVSDAVPRPPLQVRKPADLKSRLSSLRPVGQLAFPASVGTSGIPSSVQPSSDRTNPVADKREDLRELYVAGCVQCPLARSRKKFVFGGGNAEAPVMVIGEAPGVDEDEQGLPFVGAAGALLTTMLSAIGLDRSQDVFITNVLKCHPPENRNPEAAEILTCMPLLRRQIAIIAPKAILLLGRIAAHALLDVNESIAKLRSRVLDYRTIPVMVIYHPAALLRNAQYKRPAWEDLKRFQSLLASMDIYGSLSTK